MRMPCSSAMHGSCTIAADPSPWFIVSFSVGHVPLPPVESTGVLSQPERGADSRATHDTFERVRDRRRACSAIRTYMRTVPGMSRSFNGIVYVAARARRWSETATTVRTQWVTHSHTAAQAPCPPVAPTLIVYRHLRPPAADWRS
jgi:hypothetical protein